MAEELQHQTADERLGQEFWTQPEEALRNGALQLMYSNLVSVLRDEIASNHGSAVDLMIAERAAFMYAYMREREAMTGPGQGMSDRGRREMNKDLVDLLLVIKKLWSVDAKNDVADKVLAKVNKSLFTVLKDLPEETGKKLQRELADAFEANGL